MINMISMNKKANLGKGMEAITAFFVAILIIGVIGFALIIVIGNLGESSTDALPTLTDGNGTRMNETLTSVNRTGVNFAVSTLTSPVCTIIRVDNQTGGIEIDSGNYSQTGCNIKTSIALDGDNNAGFNNTLWNVTYTYTFKSPDAKNSLQNITAGSATFFSNAGTWFTLLSVLIIILIVIAVVAIVVVVGRNKGASGATI